MEHMVFKLVTSEEVLGIVIGESSSEYEVEYPVRAVMLQDNTVRFIPFIACTEAVSVMIPKRSVLVNPLPIAEDILESYLATVEQLRCPNIIMPDNKPLILG